MDCSNILLQQINLTQHGVDYAHKLQIKLNFFSSVVLVVLVLQSSEVVSFYTIMYNRPSFIQLSVVLNIHFYSSLIACQSLFYVLHTAYQISLYKLVIGKSSALWLLFVRQMLLLSSKGQGTAPHSE